MFLRSRHGCWEPNYGSTELRGPLPLLHRGHQARRDRASLVEVLHAHVLSSLASHALSLGRRVVSGEPWGRDNRMALHLRHTPSGWPDPPAPVPAHAHPPHGKLPCIGARARTEASERLLRGEVLGFGTGRT